jgi:RsiW-degrading membrane proteinase PrsW (M82 family)
LTILLSFLFLKGNILNFGDRSGSVIKVTFNGLFRNSGGQGFEFIERFWPISVVIILIPLISLITILLFRNRKTQSWFALSGIFLAGGLVLLSVYYTYVISLNYATQIVPGFKMLIPMLLLILNYLAYRGIKKDDDLVKSYDRLR